ncbi:MAG TPA: MerR family transcriptional regulator [Gammaproteobacteria bacterium]|nr:MerR family transcriptional regulator [Gammaproteobacteria bacterium]
MADSLTIGQLAKRAGVKVETIRFYERRGLLAEPGRSPSGYRQYPLEIVARVKFIRRAKSLGFTLNDIQSLLALSEGPGSCRDIRAQALAKVEEVEQRIQDLQRVRSALRELAGRCEEDAGAPRECPILKALYSDEGGL